MLIRCVMSRTIGGEGDDVEPESSWPTSLQRSAVSWPFSPSSLPPLSSAVWPSEFRHLRPLSVESTAASVHSSARQDWPSGTRYRDLLRVPWVHRPSSLVSVPPFYQVRGFCPSFDCFPLCVSHGHDLLYLVLCLCLCVNCFLPCRGRPFCHLFYHLFGLCLVSSLSPRPSSCDGSCVSWRSSPPCSPSQRSDRTCVILSWSTIRSRIFPSFSSTHSTPSRPPLKNIIHHL